MPFEDGTYHSLSVDNDLLVIYLAAGLALILMIIKRASIQSSLLLISRWDDHTLRSLEEKTDLSSGSSGSRGQAIRYDDTGKKRE
jgi:hypothetical protein